MLGVLCCSGTPMRQYQPDKVGLATGVGLVERALQEGADGGQAHTEFERDVGEALAVQYGLARLAASAGVSP